MSARQSRTPSSDLAAIAKLLARGKKPSVLPSTVPLGKIKLWPGLFQHRQLQGYDSERHVKRMADSVKRKPSDGLHPITVWWDGRAWACIDGHHRHAAYILACTDRAKSVAVEVFSGTLDDAIGQAAERNTQDKLPMTGSEKSDSAWRLVSNTQLTKEKVSKLSGVSDSQVAIMRRAFKLLEARDAALAFDKLSANHRDMRWADARRLAEGNSKADYDYETETEKKAKAMAMKLRIALGTQGAQFPHVMARALEIYDPRLPDPLAEYWAEAMHDVDDDAAEEPPAMAA